MAVKFKNIGFGTPLQNKSGHINMANWKPGDKIKFGLGLDLDSFDSHHRKEDIRAKLWTNIGHNSDPKTFYEIPMNPVQPSDQHELAFESDVPVDRVGTYKVTAAISGDQGKTWSFINDFGFNDLVFRPKPAEWEAINMRQVHIGKANAPVGALKFSYLEDMIESKWGNYNLEGLKSQGVNAIWIQSPFRADPWDHRNPADTAGSPYACTDYFSIDPRLCREAQEKAGLDKDKQHEIANQVMKKLIDKAHNQGIKVFFCMAPNHVGHNYIFRDLFDDGRGGLKVSRNDFSNMVLNQNQLDEINSKLRDPNISEPEKSYAEYLYPRMYATQKNGHFDPAGAQSVNETIHDVWYGDWSDTKKLNHGAFAATNIHEARNEQNYKVLDYLGRAMLHATVFLGVDGWRIDHSTGMPDQYFYETLPKYQAAVDRYFGQSHPIFIMAEDHDRKTWTAKVSDLVQSKWYEEIMHSMNHQDVELFWGTLANPYFQELVQTGNHDEARAIRAFDGNMLALGRYACTMELFGGAFSMLMADEYGEQQKMKFLSYGGIPSLEQARNNQLPEPNKTLKYWISRAGELKTNHPSLRSGDRVRLKLKDMKQLPVIAFARHSYEQNNIPVLVFTNLSNEHKNGAFYELDKQSRDLLERLSNKKPETRFQVRDLMGKDPNAWLWSTAKSKQELLDQGICVLLDPYQIQALELVVVD